VQTVLLCGKSSPGRLMHREKARERRDAGFEDIQIRMDWFRNEVTHER
jgi:hypothetical protein